jgi:hypothetical protein
MNWILDFIKKIWAVIKSYNKVLLVFTAFIKSILTFLEEQTKWELFVGKNVCKG